MSYDFELYAASAASLPKPPETSTGNVRCDGPDKMEDDDVPESFLPIVGKKRWIHRIHLEGEISAEERQAVSSWLREAITTSRGVLIDLQTATYETATKSGTVAPGKREQASSGSMSFYFVDGEAFYERGFRNMLATMAEHYPTAIPTRYGYYEPLQGKVSQGDYAEIVAAFQSDTSLFMKSPTPFGHIFVSVPCKKTFERWHPRHFVRRHHLLGRIEFELRPTVFSTVASRDALSQLFKKLSAELKAVYADILESGGGGSWFWYGLPDRQQVHTSCIGPAYQSVWPEASVGGEVVGDGLRVFSSSRFGDKPPRPPSDLLAPGGTFDAQGKPAYAAIFPFEYEFDYDRYVW